MIKANDVKKYLKENGIDTKDISVRIRNQNSDKLPTHIFVTLKNILLDDVKISKLAIDKFQVIESNILLSKIRDDSKNTYVFVDFDEEMEDNYNKLLESEYENDINYIRYKLDNFKSYKIKVSDEYDILVYKDTDDMFKYTTRILDRVNNDYIYEHKTNWDGPGFVIIECIKDIQRLEYNKN